MSSRQQESIFALRRLLRLEALLLLLDLAAKNDCATGWKWLSQLGTCVVSQVNLDHLVAEETSNLDEERGERDVSEESVYCLVVKLQDDQDDDAHGVPHHCLSVIEKLAGYGQ